MRGQHPFPRRTSRSQVIAPSDAIADDRIDHPGAANSEHRFGDDPIARSHPDRRRDARSHSTERVASARRLVRDCSATDPVFRGRHRCPEAHTRARANAGSAQRTGRIRASPLQGIGCARSQLTIASERRGAGLRSDRLPRRRRGRLAPAGRSLEGASGRIPAAARSTCVKRSIETIRTSCSTRSTPRARTRHMTPRVPLRAHLRRRRDSHAACSRTRARWRPS